MWGAQWFWETKETYSEVFAGEAQKPRSGVWEAGFQRLPGSRCQSETQHWGWDPESHPGVSYGVEPGTTASAPPGALSCPRQVVGGIPENPPLRQGTQRRDPETPSSRSQDAGNVNGGWDGPRSIAQAG